MLVSWLKLVLGLGLCFSFCLSLMGCGATPKPAPAARPIAPLSYLGAPCNVLTAKGCNPIQLPSTQPPSFDPHCSQDSSKCWVKLPVNGTELLDYDFTEQREEHITAERSESIQEVSRTNSFDFGLGPEVSIWGALAFSAGIQYRQLSKDMDVYRTEQFYANIQQRHIVYSASLSSSARQKLATAFHTAVSVLPQEPSTDDEFAKWFQFFEDFGTHYVKKVSFGGLMRLSLFVKSTLQRDTRIQKANWTFYLQLMFARLAGIKLPLGPGHSEKEFESFNRYTFKQHFFAKGGNESELDYEKWLATLRSNPAPVQTHLASVEDFFNTSVNFTRILKRYLAICPSSETSGVCNGYGVCDFARRRCECDAIGAYKEEDGNCYPTCQKNCSGHGKCKDGRCQCHFDAKANMGFMTVDGEAPCSTPCGSKVYDAGESHAWCIPGSTGPNCKVLGREAEAAKCWCQGELKSLDVDAGRIKQVDLDWSTDTYSCGDGSSSCIHGWNPLKPWEHIGRPPCSGYQQIECTHGEHLRCTHQNAYHQVNYVNFSRETAVQWINSSNQKSLIV